MLHTPLYQEHLAQQCKLIPFGDWEMPLHYGSQLEEHHAVRQRAGVFDVSHMMITDLIGKDSCQFLRQLLANDVAKLKIGQGLYTCILNEQGGILDDAIIYSLTPTHYRLVSNAGTRNKIKEWLLEQQKKQKTDLQITFQTEQTILALQGPDTFKILAEISPNIPELASLKPFYIMPYKTGYLARTGYTGELGVEIMLPARDGIALWQSLMAKGVQACGLGARDTLRLEMGYGLYGIDMDETTTPLESNLAWTVNLNPDRDFIGKSALLEQQEKAHSTLSGLILQEKGVPRGHYSVLDEQQQPIGVITSGTFSPTLEQGIALARFTSPNHGNCFVKIREQLVPAIITRPPFIKRKPSHV